MSDVGRTDYERIAPRYDEDRAAWEIPIDETVLAMASELGRVTALDLGCGTGKYLAAQAHHIRGRSMRWAGVDPSAAMLAVAEPKLPDAQLIRGRAETLPLANGSFDYIHTSFAFHHFGDKAAALDEVTRVLGPHGVFRLINVHLSRRWWGYLFFEGAWEIDEARFWTVEQTVSGLVSRGFEVDHKIEVATTLRRIDEIQEDAERRVSSQLAVLDDELYEQGLSRIAATLADDGDATVETDSARLELTAKRS